jgi:hypothetical protein
MALLLCFLADPGHYTKKRGQRTKTAQGFPNLNSTQGRCTLIAKELDHNQDHSSQISTICEAIALSISVE